MGGGGGIMGILQPVDRVVGVVHLAGERRGGGNGGRGRGGRGLLRRGHRVRGRQVVRSEAAKSNGNNCTMVPPVPFLSLRPALLSLHVLKRSLGKRFEGRLRVLRKL